MKIKATVNNQVLELDIDEQSLVKAGYVKAKKEYKRWRAGIDKGYYFVTGDGIVSSADEQGDCVDDGRYTIGNYYQTKELAQAALDRQLALVRVNDRILELNEGWEAKWDNARAEKFYISYYHPTKRFEADYKCWYQESSSLSCVKSEDLCLQIISECEDDLKVIFKV